MLLAVLRLVLVLTAPVLRLEILLVAVFNPVLRLLTPVLTELIPIDRELAVVDNCSTFTASLSPLPAATPVICRWPVAVPTPTSPIEVAVPLIPMAAYFVCAPREATELEPSATELAWLTLAL